MLRFLGKLNKDGRGATAVEYGLILSLLILAMLGALKGFTSEAIRVWDDVSSASAEARGG